MQVQGDSQEGKDYSAPPQKKIDSLIFTTLCYFVSNFMIEELNIGEYPAKGWISYDLIRYFKL